MQWYMPVRVYDEENAVRRHGTEIAALGKRALIVSGPHSADACGALEDVTAALAEQGLSWVRFAKVEENPSTDTVLEAAKLGLAEKADLIIGIGGGSPMDAAKAVAYAMCQEELTKAVLYDASRPVRALPVVAIPTSCGTGSEVTGVAVLTNHEKRTKQSMPHKIFPALALIDGRYLRSASHSLIVNTSLDAFAHMTESAFSAKADVYSLAMVRAGLELWDKTRPILLGEREPEDADYALLMRSAAFGGLAIAQTGTSVPHALSYTVTYDEKVPHGKACAGFLPGFLSKAPQAERDKVLSWAGLADLEGLTRFLRLLYPDYALPSAALERSYASVAAQKVRLQSASFPIDEESLREMAFYSY